MNKIILKSIMGRGYLLFILLFGVFIGKNVFAVQYWEKNNLQVKYYSQQRIISIDVIFDDYKIENDEHGFLRWSEFSYSYDGQKYTNLIKSKINDQKGQNRVSISMWYKKYGEEVHIVDVNTPRSHTVWYDLDNLFIKAKALSGLYKSGEKWEISKRCKLRINWFLSKSCTSIKSIKISGFWKINDERYGNVINDVYMLDYETN